MSSRSIRKHMAEDKPDIEAIRRFRTPEYGAVKMIRAQAEQIREDPAEYVARKYGIRGDVDGSGKTEQAQEE